MMITLSANQVIFFAFVLGGAAMFIVAALLGSAMAARKDGK